MRTLAVFALLFIGSIASVSGTTARQAQSNKPQTDKPQTSNAQAQFLVASRDLADPFFRQSVVLMLPIKEGPLLAGIILNKPTRFKLRNVFPDSAELQKMDAKVYFGGPVDADVMARSAIFRSKTPPKDATLVFGDVYVSFDPKAIAALAGDSQQAATLRVFLGRAQWGTAQFDNEVAKGAWHPVPASADSIFTTFPETVWRTLIDQIEPPPIVQAAPPSLPLADAFAAFARHSAPAW